MSTRPMTRPGAGAVKRIRWRRDTIRIRIALPSGGDRLVDAKVCGGLAIHPMQSVCIVDHNDPDAWTVTHVASGRAVPPPGITTKARASAYARALLALGDWTREDVSDLRAGYERVRREVWG